MHKQAEAARESQIKQMQRAMQYESELNILRKKNEMMHQYLIK